MENNQLIYASLSALGNKMSQVEGMDAILFNSLSSLSSHAIELSCSFKQEFCKANSALCVKFKILLFRTQLVF